MLFSGVVVVGLAHMPTTSEAVKMAVRCRSTSVNLIVTITCRPRNRCQILWCRPNRRAAGVNLQRCPCTAPCLRLELEMHSTDTTPLPGPQHVLRNVSRSEPRAKQVTRVADGLVSDGASGTWLLEIAKPQIEPSQCRSGANVLSAGSAITEWIMPLVTTAHIV